MAGLDRRHLSEAKPQTAAEHEAAVVEAAQLRTRLEAVKAKGRAVAWELAAIYHAISEVGAWVVWGFESQADWLAEEGVSYRTFRRLVEGWHEMAVLRGLDLPTLAGLDPSKVDIAVPALKRGEVALEAVVEDVQGLTARELRAKYAEADAPALAGPPELPQAAPPSAGLSSPNVRTPDPAGDGPAAVDGAPPTPAAPELQLVPPPLPESDPTELTELEAALERARAAVPRLVNGAYVPVLSADLMRAALIALAEQTTHWWAFSLALRSLLRAHDEGVGT